MGALGGDKIVLILVLVLILFGGQKIPEMMRGLGQGMKEFKKATRDEEEDHSLPHPAAVPTVTVPTAAVPPVGVPTTTVPPASTAVPPVSTPPVDRL